MDELIKSLEHDTHHEDSVQTPHKVVGVLTLHIKSLQMVDKEVGISASDQLKLSINIGNNNSTLLSVTTSTDNTDWLLCDTVQHLSVELIPDSIDSSNILFFKLYIISPLLVSHKTMLGTAQQHLYDIIKESPARAQCLLYNDNKLQVATIDITYVFSYGAFGYGDSYQIYNSKCKPEEHLQWSAFPRVAPSEEHTDTNGLILSSKSLEHPNFIPFSQQVHLCSRDDLRHKSSHEPRPPPEQLMKQMKRLPLWHLQYNAIRNRTKKLQFLEAIVYNSQLKMEQFQGLTPHTENQSLSTH